MRGSIIAEQAYAQGKMLDHSSWRLPRLITPSDIDMIICNGNRILFMELSKQTPYWRGLKLGQRWAYESLVENSPSQAACLLYHQVPTDKQIDTLTDIISFSFLTHKDGKAIPSRVCKNQGNLLEKSICKLLGFPEPH